MKNSFDLNKFQKIGDIIYIDEPILSHLQFNNIDYFLYLVETTNNSDIYLLFEVENGNIVRYLTERKSLRKLIQDNPRNMLLLEQNFMGEIIDVNTILACEVEEDYLPQEDSLFSLEPIEGSYYHNLISEYESKYYLETLREKAFYLKFSTINKKYADTIGLKDITNIFLNRLNKSYTSFIKISFKRKFNTQFSDKIMHELDFRIVDLNFGSFELGLAIDEVMKNNIEDLLVKQWAKEIGYDYLDIVLSEDISNDHMESILNEYSEDERLQIFKPIIDITKNENFYFKIKKNQNGKYNSIGVSKKTVASKILSRTKVKALIESKQNLELVQITAIIDKKGNTNTIKIQDSLFNKAEKIDHLLKFNDFKKYNYLDMPNNVEIKVTMEQINENSFILKADYDNNPFEVNVFDRKIEIGMRNMIKKIYEYYKNHN
ncbi:hypothetical protein [Myroides odoratimimus]|uniref:hypothetical protein n=1 Tax=Myroides odoratimimus TaxID=76832 RepID=UPI003101A45B